MLPIKTSLSELGNCLTYAVALTLATSAAAYGSSYSVISQLYGSAIGSITGDLVGDGGGHIYGTGIGIAGSTFGGVFRLNPPASGSTVWTSEGDGFYPAFPPGTVVEGGVALVSGAFVGATTQDGAYGFGTVFSIGFLGSPVLHNFGGQSVKPHDGAKAYAGMVQGPSRLLYGTTNSGGDGPGGGAGTIFSISPSVSRPSYHVLHRFGSAGDGANPGYGRLTLDPSGRLFGTTQYGGDGGQGTAYMLQRVAGKWQEQVIYSFSASPGLYGPVANVALDSAGNLYGCASGGAHRQGGVYKLLPPTQAGGQWTESVLYAFGTAASDPVATSPTQGCGVSYDTTTTGRLYGTSWAGGASSLGTIWQLDPPAVGQTAWTETIIHSFTGPFDGENPTAEPVRIGAAYYGGTGYGTVYQFTP